MNNFFSLDQCYFHFTLFGGIHIISTLITLFAIFLIYKNKEQLRKWKYHDTFMRYFIASTMFINMLIYYGYKVIDGSWTYMEHLPLHFCYISGYLFMLTMFTKNKKLFKYVYFFSFAGPFPAMILPDLVCSVDRFIFYQWFISHHFFTISAVYVLFVLKWKVEKKDALKAIIAANIIFITIFLFNLVFDTNYIMTEQLPEYIIRLFPFITLIDFPTVWLEIVGILSIAVAYIPVHILNKKKNTR